MKCWEEAKITEMQRKAQTTNPNAKKLKAEKRVHNKGPVPEGWQSVTQKGKELLKDQPAIPYFVSLHPV